MGSSVAFKPHGLDAASVIARLRGELRSHFGSRLKRAVLFGSRARGVARDDSDYDVAVFLHPYLGRSREMDAWAEVAQALLEETGAFVTLIPYPENYDASSPLMVAIQEDGVSI